MSKSDALLRELPWVIERKTLVACDGVVWSRATRRNITKTPGGLTFLSDFVMCRNEARWHFTALPGSHARSGDFCWHHLMSQCLFADMDEDQRAEDWMRANPEIVRAVRPDLYAEDSRWDDLP